MLVIEKLQTLYWTMRHCHSTTQTTNWYIVPLLWLQKGFIYTRTGLINIPLYTTGILSYFIQYLPDFNIMSLYS